MAIFQIKDFTGNITRKRIGEMNSGLARVGKTHSVDPFTNNPVLTFNETATNLDPTHATITDLIVDGVINEESGTAYIYCVDRSGSVYKINTATDAITPITNSLGITIKYGGNIKIMISSGKTYLFITHDGITSGGHTYCALFMGLDGSNPTNVSNETGGFFKDTDVNISNDEIALGNEMSILTLVPGQGILMVGGSVPLPSPLAYGTLYYIIPVDSTNIKLAATYADALAGNAINITDTGAAGGTFDISIINWIVNIPHPCSDEFFGSFQIGNGPYLVDWAIGSLTVTHSSRLNPTFPNNYTINSVAVDSEGRYMRINATTGATQDIITQDPVSAGQAPFSRTLYWNGIDATYDSMDPFMQTTASSMFSFLGNDIGFAQDFWGSGMFQDSSGSIDKMVAIKEIKPPQNNAITSTGNLMLFAASYFVQSAWLTGIFSFGALDDQDQPGMYALLGIPCSNSNTISVVAGMLRVVQNRVIKSDGTTLTNSKMYVSSYEVGTSPHANLYSFNLTPGNGTPNAGVFESQIEYFTLMQQVDRVAIYQTASAAGVSWKIELVDVDSTVPSGAALTYTYAGGSDETLLQGSLEIINWENLGIKNMQGAGVRITNLGTVQPNITQVYIETHDVDKAQGQPQ